MGGDALLYVEAGPGWVNGSIFIDYPTMIEWVSPADYHVDELTVRLWTSTPEAKKWRALTMHVGEGVFRTEFGYGGGWLNDQDESHRREEIVRRFFGDKLVVYSTLWSDGAADDPVNSVTFTNS